jgi:hypothetical protein
MEDIPEGGELLVGMDMEWLVDLSSSIQGHVAVISIALEKEIYLLQVIVSLDTNYLTSLK